MRYVPCWKQIGISKDRYIELLHFCRQYPEWKSEASSLLGIRGIRNNGQPKRTGRSDPVAMAAEKREKLLEKIKFVEDCAKAVGSGEWSAAIIQNVCIGKPYSMIESALIPNSDRNTFFRMRREFFILIDRKTE